ncbi:MAG: Gfo/Idh/MocA family oxidoreductase [Verrucomicrobiales bacterium]|nr:Gfo/Idh/MocA family oxidoreductase [Verrucomicrobiales bacterium]
MSENHPQILNEANHNRRDFIKTSAGAAVAAGALSATITQGAGIPADKKIKIGFIGTGGRGTGAVAQALSADDNMELHAVADVFQEQIDKSLATLSKDKKFSDKVKVPKERQFVGIDAYKRVIDSDVDMVILTTCPGFRPQHLKAAVEAGKHIFTEKPMAVDAAGVQSCLKTVALSKTKPIAMVAGFCWRYHPSRRAAFKKVLEEGMIGDITAVYATYYGGYSKPHLPASARGANESDIEWQLRNWYNYSWLGGGGLVEQAIHSVDKIGWVMGDQAPISCRSVGGLQVPQEGGNIFDHIHASYEYPNNVWCHLGQRKLPGCYGENADFIVGTKGKLIIGKGKDPYIEDHDGKVIWKWRKPRKDAGAQNMYQVEHNELFASIRSGNFINDGDRMINSTMLGIMARIAAHSGQSVTWEQALNSGEDLGPDEPAWGDSFKPNSVPMPGKSKDKLVYNYKEA